MDNKSSSLTAHIVSNCNKHEGPVENNAEGAKCDNKCDSYVSGGVQMKRDRDGEGRRVRKWAV